MKRRNAHFLTAGLSLMTCVAAVGFPTGGTKPIEPQKVDFNRDVRPILAQHCWTCHGSDSAELAKTGDMRLNTFEGATADRGGHKAIEPGHPERSKLIELCASKDPDVAMPPVASGVKKLSSQELEILTLWIKDGAEFRAHWAFVPPVPPVVPKVQNQKWVKNDIDRFVLARLQAAKLKPEPSADRATLIRRVTLTLTGLPPTPEEVDAFVKDKSPQAYERVVDRLLANPHFGENQARYWMDAVRYADTHGLHIDNERAVFPYRDWVVRAYNQDLPYDKFVTWQLAGDLLPNPTTEQKIATGYVRMNPTTNEGGAIEAEFLAKNTMDRVDTTSTVLLGLTVQCAKCHDHKYDPITMKDYYSLYAFFNSTADTPLDGNLKLHEPVMKAPNTEQTEKIDAVRSKMLALVKTTSFEPARDWVTLAADQVPIVGKWEASGPYIAATFDQAFDGQSAPEGGSSNLAPWKPIDLVLEQPLNNFIGKENAASYLRTKITVAKATKIELRLGSDDAIKAWVNGKLIHSNKAMRALLPIQDTVTANLKSGENEILIKIVNAAGNDGAFVGVGGADKLKIVEAGKLARKPAASELERQKVIATYLELGPETAQKSQYRTLLAEYKKAEEDVPMTYIAQELAKPRPTYILKRGQYDTPGEMVGRAVPFAFGTLPPDAPKNRLGLAEWMTSPKNPLTARVMVNRIWQQHFGQGLVKSSEDFGTRGESPSHPELLDYLATKFIQDGWSIKKLTRLIVTSAAYQQASTAPETKRLKDPDNTLISRGPRFRLDAEVIRDSALFASGLLVDNPGGHADKPYQPSGLWEIIAYPISDTAKYKQDHNSALYRRSLYLFWKRTSPPPEMMILDAPMRESCVVRRSRTNTPTQALVTLNETGFVEDARAMAQRVIKHDSSDSERLRYAFKLASGRAPTVQEVAVLDSFLKDQLVRYRANPKDAEKTLAVGESARDTSIPGPDHAAWMMTCNLILNLDETLTQH